MRGITVNLGRALTLGLDNVKCLLLASVGINNAAPSTGYQSALGSSPPKAIPKPDTFRAYGMMFCVLLRADISGCLYWSCFNVGGRGTHA